MMRESEFAFKLVAAGMTTEGRAHETTRLIYPGQTNNAVDNKEGWLR